MGPGTMIWRRTRFLRRAIRRSGRFVKWGALAAAGIKMIIDNAENDGRGCDVIDVTPDGRDRLAEENEELRKKIETQEKALPENPDGDHK